MSSDGASQRLLLVNKAYANVTVDVAGGRSGTLYTLDERNWNTRPVKTRYTAGAALQLYPYTTAVLAFN